MKDVTEPIEITVNFDSSIDIVWKAITNLNQMKQWFFETIESFEPITGFKTQFEVFSGDRKFTHLWEITKVIPYNKISYNWKYSEYSGNSFVTFELYKINDKLTSLKLTHTTTENFPINIPEFLRESGVQGWNFFIKKNLKEYLHRLNS